MTEDWNEAEEREKLTITLRGMRRMIASLEADICALKANLERNKVDDIERY